MRFPAGNRTVDGLPAKSGPPVPCGVGVSLVAFHQTGGDAASALRACHLKMKHLRLAHILHHDARRFKDMKKVTLLLAGALMALAPLGASAAVRVFVGGPAFGYGYGFYHPYYWGPAYYGPFDTTGTIKIDVGLR